MKIKKEFKAGECYFDNGIRGMPVIITILLDDDSVLVDFGAIISTQFTGGNVSDRYEDLKRALGLGQFSSAPGGGFINFYALMSEKGVEYVLFSGVNEVNNSHYVVTVHKIIAM